MDNDYWSDCTECPDNAQYGSKVGVCIQFCGHTYNLCYVWEQKSQTEGTAAHPCVSKLTFDYTVFVKHIIYVLQSTEPLTSLLALWLEQWTLLKKGADSSTSQSGTESAIDREEMK